MSKQFRVGTFAVACAVVLLGSGPILAGEFDGGGCGSCASGAGCSNCSSCKRPCPPHFKWWVEGPPKLCYKCSCPRPVCDPCSLEHFGYYATCWAPWPYPPDWSHCPTPPPGEMLPPPPYPPYTPRTPQDYRRPEYRPNGDRDRDRDPDLPAPTPRRDERTPTARLTSVTPYQPPQEPVLPPPVRKTAAIRVIAQE